MKTRSFFCALFLVLAGPSFSQATDAARLDDEKQIRKIEQEWLDAIVKRDAAYLQKLESPDFSVTGPGGRTLNKEEDIKDMTSGETTFEKMTIERLKVRFYGDTAIANGIAEVKAHTKGKDDSGRYSWTDVFVKMNGEWKAVSGHVTVVVPEKK
jgi:ketosteroid isomerase-like protein